MESANDAGGGFDVGWIQPGEWLEWEEVPIQGSAIHLQVRVASPVNTGRIHFVIDGTNYPVINVPNTGGYQNWATVDSGFTAAFAKGSIHTVRLVCDNGGFNVNYWQYHDDIPIGANIRLQAQANSKWVSASNLTLSANASVPGTNELFTVVDASGTYGCGYVALLAQRNGLYVTADTNGTSPLIASASSVGLSQMFEWADNGDGTILLRAVANGLVVSATNNPASYPLVPARIRSNVGVAETFSLTKVSSNTLAFVARINNTSAGTRLTAGALGEVQVLAANASGSPAAGVAVTLGLVAGVGSVTGNIATTDAGGIAHFTNLQINNAGTKILQASSSAFAPVNSGAFDIVAGPSTALTLETQADGNGAATGDQSLAAGASINVYAICRDTYGNYVTNVAAAWSLVNQTGGVAAGDLTSAGDSRTATFTGHLVGSARIQAIATLAGQSGVQTVVAGPAAALVVSQQPSAVGRVGQPLAQQPVVVQTDAFGNLSTSPVTVVETDGQGNVNRNPNGVVVAPVNGVAVFSGLYLTNLGINSLTFSAGSASVRSSVVNMAVGDVERLVWSVGPSRATNGFPFGTSPVIQTADAGGNVSMLGLPVTKFVVVSIYSGSGALLGNVITNIGTAGGNGVVILTNLSINLPGTFQLIVQDIGNACNPTNIAAGGACQLWLDAADATTLDSWAVGSTVSQWNDKSGHGNNAVGSATLVIDSQLTATSPGQGLALNFNGAQRLAMDLSSLSNSPYTILVMEVGASKTGGASYFIGNSGGYNTDLTLGVGYQTATQFRWQQYIDDLNYNSVFTNAVARLWTMNLNGTPQKSLYLNSALVGTAASGFLKGSNLVNGSVGCNSYVGDLAEVIVYNTSLGTNEQASLENYLANKWLTGLTPAITQPFNVTAPGYSPVFENLAVARMDGGMVSIALRGGGGPPGGTYRLLSGTNVGMPLSAWTPVLTNAFDSAGAFSSSIPVNAAEPARYFRLIQP